MTVMLVPDVTDEQAMLVEISSRYMADSFPLPATRRRADRGGVEAELNSYRRGAADLGWFGLLAGEDTGGGSLSGNGVLDAALVAAERGALLQPGPFVGHSVCVDALASTGVRPDVLRRLAAGEVWASWAFDGSRSCTVTASPHGWRLSGHVELLPEGELCGWLLVTAAAEAGPVSVLVPVAGTGVSGNERHGIDITRKWSRLDFDDVGVDIVGEVGVGGTALLDRQVQLAAVLSAAETVGAMHADFELAVQYSKDRIAFGRPIGSFQAIKHLLADTSLSLEMSKGIVAAAAAALGSDGPDGPQLAHAAKAFVADHGVELAHNCFQVFGGIGYTWEHDQHLYFRRIAADAQTAGNAAWHRSKVLDEAGAA
jgi:alkylation response protein AidB-like acyl-CoA dehydrogenase